MLKNEFKAKIIETSNTCIRQVLLALDKYYLPILLNASNTCLMQVLLASSKIIFYLCNKPIFIHKKYVLSTFDHF